MLSSGVESLLDSSVSAVIEELYTGLPESISTELMAVSEPHVGLDVNSDVSMPVLAHSDGLSAEHHRTSGVENFCQKTEDLSDVLKVISQGPAESLTEELLKAGDLEGNEKNKKRNFRKLDCCSDGYQKEDTEARGAEECHAECCAVTPGESWSKQEDPYLNQHEVRSSRTCCTEIAGSLKNREESQANVQVTAETLPKLTEEVQGMKADGTRIFSKAGYRNDRVRKGLPPESNESPDVDTVMATAGVSGTSTLDFLEPLKVTDVESATEHPQQTNEYNGLKAHTAVPLRPGVNVSILDIREEKLPRQNPVNEFSTSLANCQTYQQDEESNAHVFCTGPVPKHNEPHRLSSIESCRTLSTKSSVLKSICYLDFRNMPLENNSTAVHGIINESPKPYLPDNIKSQTHYDHGTGIVENRTSTSVPVEQISVVRSKELSSAKIDHREVSASIGKLYSSEFEEAAEVRRKIAVGDNVEVGSWPEAQEGANSEHCHSSVFSSVASSPEEFSKEKLKMVPSEGDKLKEDQWHFSVSDLCKDKIKENSLLMEMSDTASHEIGQTDMCFYNTSSKSSPPSSHNCLDRSIKLEKDSPEAQLLEEESESNTTSEELAGSLVEATEADSNDSLSTGKETYLVYTLNVPLPPVAQKSREPHCNECPPCTANEVSSRDKAQDNLSGKESIGASGTTGEQVAQIVLHKDKFKSSVSSRTFDNPNMTRKISQKNMKSSAGNTESVVSGLENEHSDTWNCNNQSIKDQCTAASTSCVLSGSTGVDDVLLNSYSFNVEVDKKIEENDNLEGEVSAGYNSKKAVIFPEARFPLACGSLPSEDDWSNRGVDLHGINDISTGKTMLCSAYTAEKSIATLVGDEISSKNMEVMKQFDLCKVTDGSEIVCDRDEAKEQIGLCALQTDEFDKLRTVDSSKAPEGNQRNKTSEQLLVRYLNKKTCVHNFGFCNSPLGPKKGEVGTFEKKKVSSLTANTSEYSASICDTCPLISNMNIQTQHASQTEKILHPMENQCRACQSEFDGPVPGSKQHLESLNNQPTTGLQTVEKNKMSIGCSQSEEILLKTSDNLPQFVHKYAKQDSFQGTPKENVVDLDSLNGAGNEDRSGYVGFIIDQIEEKTVELKEHRNGCEREDKGTLEESSSDSKSHCSQQVCLIKCAKEKAELVFAGNKTQQSLAKMEEVEDPENTVSARFLPFSSIHGSLSYKPENMNVLSETENKRSLRIKPILNNSVLQLTVEPSKETNAQKGIGLSHFRKSDIQESFNETQADSETPSALNLGIFVPENTQIDNCDSSSAEDFSKGSSVTKPLSVTMSVKRKASNTEIPSSENETATSFLKGAKSSRVCAHSKESLRDEGHSMLTVKDKNVTSPKGTHCGEKLKNTCVEEEMGREVASRKKLHIDSFLDGEDCLRALLEDSKESGSKILSLSTENYEKVLEEIPRSNLSNLSKERKNTTKLTNLAGASLLSETVRDCQAEDASEAGTSPELQYNATPTSYPCLNMLSNNCKESSPNCVTCSEVHVPYKLNAQSKDNVKEITEGQHTIPARSVSKENEVLGSERLDQTEKCQVLKRKKYEKMEVHLSDKAQEEQKSGYQEEAKITLQPSMSHSSELSCSSSNELVTLRNMKFEGPSEEIFAVRSSENELHSTLQEVKRPKITTDVISSQFLKTQDSEVDNLNLNLGYDGIPGAFGTTNKLRGPLPLKRQPGRTCKKIPTSHQLKAVRKGKKSRSSPFFEIPPELFPKQENTLLKSLYFPCKPPTMETETAMRFVHVPRQRAKRCNLLNSLKFRKCTKEPALLGELSAMASKLLAPAKSIHNLEPLPYSSEILPVAERYSQRRSKNLLEAFSCINRNLHSRWADSWCTKMFSFQPLALYPAESTKILFSDLSHKPPTSFLDTPVFPISFHITLDSGRVTDLTGIIPQHSVHHRPVLGEMPAPPSKWTFSFLLSQSCSDTTALKEDSSLDNELHSSLSVRTPRAVALHPDHGRNAVAERRGGCSMLGLHTVLALSSPGCYRIWTRRRNLTSHIPTIQRLFISQFAQGLKGTRYPTSVSDDLVSSLPYSLGRVLSIWSQHGPSARPSEITPLHSNHCKWQPSVGIENSYAMLPHLPVQSMEALQTAGHEIRLETSFPLPLPKSCSLPVSSPSPPRLSASELQIHALDEADASVPACLRSQDDTELKKIEPEKRPKKVSQIRIRKTVPKPDPNLTPMGLPKPKRLKKKEFSLEEIYTNKNYKSPPPARSLETIFEEPKEKNGRLISVSQQKRKRILEFQDFTLPRKRKTRGKIKAVGSFTRAKKAALQSAELDALLSQKLMDLEAFFAREAEQEQASSI
ncbi:protein PRR14L isoform X1 [Grus americana]|nr:protein PRR14L isoform X1 [Grus americana]